MKSERQYRPYKATLLRESQVVEEDDLNAWLQRSNAPQAAAKKRGDGRLAKVLPAHGGPVSLLDYQTDVVRQVRCELEGRKSCIVSLPTGAGKTVTAMNCVLAAFALGYRRIAWLAPQRFLLSQAQSELERTWWSESQKMDVAVGNSDATVAAVAVEAGRSIIFETLQKWIKPRATDADPDFVIVDECHHIEANEFGRALDRIHATGAVILGLSASPGRSNENEFEALQRRFGRTLIVPEGLGVRPVRELQRRGVYSQISLRQLVPTFKSDRERVQVRQGAIRPQLAAQSAGRLDAVVDFVTREVAEKRVIVFGYSIAHCNVIAAALNRGGVSVEVVDSETREHMNESAIQKFKTGVIRVLVNVRYLAVGADLPAAEVVVLTVPLGSATTFEQVVGRACRGPTVGGTAEAVVADFDNHFRRFEGTQSYARFAGEWK